MKKLISLLCSLALAAAPAVALADTNTSTTATAAGPMVTAKARADQEITRRVTSLSQAIEHETAMKHLTDSEHSSLQKGLNDQITALTTLKGTIDAETNVAALKTDLQSITKGYRVYMLVLPQSRVVASADRALSIMDLMQTLGTKLQSRLSASTSTDMSALQTAYADFQSKLADAGTQANAAITGTASLAPDNGDATIAASNAAALKTARGQVEAATADLKAARADVKTILQGLKVPGAN
ncbi:MAG: hypothetical protein RLZZ26_273 [Candidatus Parcubacteria bacterium]|jgi:hypothetical protein